MHTHICTSKSPSQRLCRQLRLKRFSNTINKLKYHKAFQLFNMHVSYSATVCLLSALFFHTSIIWRMFTDETQVHGHRISYTHPPQSCRISTENVTRSSLCKKKNHYENKKQKLTEYCPSLISEYHVVVMKPRHIL